MATKQENKPTERRTQKKTKNRTPETAEYKRSVANKKTKNIDAEKENRVHKNHGKRARVRIFPVWLRVIIVIILAIAALVAGLMIGYGIIGDGTPLDALKVETWKHIIDYVISDK